MLSCFVAVLGAFLALDITNMQRSHFGCGFIACVSCMLAVTTSIPCCADSLRVLHRPRRRSLVKHCSLSVMGLIVRGSLGVVELMRTVRGPRFVTIYPRAPGFPAFPANRPAPGDEAASSAGTAVYLDHRPLQTELVVNCPWRKS